MPFAYTTPVAISLANHCYLTTPELVLFNCHGLKHDVQVGRINIGITNHRIRSKRS
jgi:hypothetical protein